MYMMVFLRKRYYQVVEVAAALRILRSDVEDVVEVDVAVRLSYK